MSDQVTAVIIDGRLFHADRVTPFNGAFINGVLCELVEEES